MLDRVVSFSTVMMIMAGMATVIFWAWHFQSLSPVFFLFGIPPPFRSLALSSTHTHTYACVHIYDISLTVL